MLPIAPPRRRPTRVTLALLCALLVSVVALPSTADATPVRDRSVPLRILATADLHGEAIGWDYTNDRPYAGNQARGLARLSTLVTRARAERLPGTTLLLDAGDTLQGTPLTHHHSRIAPADTDRSHPMAAAMNQLGYDAVTVGNHDFDYGMDVLRGFEEDLDAAVLGGNVLHAGTDEPALAPYTLHTVRVPGRKPVRVGVLGLTTPGSSLWNRHHVRGVVDFDGGIETAERWMPELERRADIVVALVHTGMSSGSSYDVDQVGHPENFGIELAETVPGIDVIVASHSHRTIPEQFITNEVTGDQVLVTQPGANARHLSVVDLHLELDRADWRVADASSELRATTTAALDPAVIRSVADAHEDTRTWLDEPVGRSVEALPLRNALTEEVAASRWMNVAQQQEVERALAGTRYADLPVLSGAPPLSTSLGLPAGPLEVRDVYSTYRYENNVLLAVKVTGADILEYLEWGASSHRSVTSAGPHARNAVGGSTFYFAPLYGLDQTYDLARPAGERVVDVRYQGEPIDPDASFILATTNYNINGGGGAPALPDAEVVFDADRHGPDVLIDWVREHGVVDPSELFTAPSWRLVHDGVPLTWSN